MSPASSRHDGVREENRHLVAELQQRLDVVEQSVVLWAEQQTVFLSLGKSTVRLQLDKIAECLDGDDFEVSMLSRSFEGLVGTLNSKSDQKRACVEHLTKEIAILAATAEPKYEHLIEILDKRRCECISHAQRNDLEIKGLAQSSDAGGFAHIYALLDEKTSLQMLIASLQVK